MKKVFLALVALAAAAVAVVMLELVRGERSGVCKPLLSADVRVDTRIAPTASAARSTSDERSRDSQPLTVGEAAQANEAPDEPQTAEEKREAEEEKRVNDFDGLTDKWMEPSPKGVSMADVDNFAKTFRKIPKTRWDECIHRALNLIPDENVMLLAGVLMDKSIDKEIVETVYNDILNRAEDVKKPILQEIFKDKTHPCWADTAWILDVTGELPKKN